MTDTSPIRILIADDHAVVREGLRSFIQIKPDMEVVGEAADGVELVEKARELEPDVILVDIVMPRQDGIAAIKQMRAEGCPARMLVITSFAEDDQIFPAIRAGATGYLLKDSKPQELIEAIRTVHRGESSLHPTIARKLIDELNQEPDLPPTEDPLTAREVEVLRLLARGLDNREIAEQLTIAEVTVRSYISRILDKLHLANRVQATLWALQENLTTLDDKR